MCSEKLNDCIVVVTRFLTRRCYTVSNPTLLQPTNAISMYIRSVYRIDVLGNKGGFTVERIKSTKFAFTENDLICEMVLQVLKIRNIMLTDMVF